MKCFTKIATVVLFAALCSAEPPIPGSQYLPPAEPSNEYLPPVQSYQAPSNNYLPPQQNARRQPPAAKPSNSYLAPDVTSAIFPNQGGNNGYPAARNGNGLGGNGNGNGNGHHQNDEDSWGPAMYEFKYDVQDDESGNNFGHMEKRDGDLTTGRYYVLLPDGRTQIVEYEADGNGYRPTITYEGVANNNGNGNSFGNGGNGFGNGAGGRGANGGNGNFAGYN